LGREGERTIVESEGGEERERWDTRVQNLRHESKSVKYGNET
jgi:hypothetical protein